MPNFAVIENDIVINTIVADSKEDAVSVTRLDCIEYFEDNAAYIGFSYKDGVFEHPELIIPEEENQNNI